MRNPVRNGILFRNCLISFTYKEENMPVTAIVGANWGDEGKGKITDLLAQNADYVVRFQGGANAGHTIINQYGRFSLHLLPSGIFSARTTNIIGSGVAFDDYRQRRCL